jgi:serine/threonine protein kinase
LNDRYEVTSFLGKGGFASVYAGFDKVIERQVAIKVLAVQPHALEEDAYADKLERFRREAKASARIAHPNVVTVFDMGVMASTMQPYIVMEVLHGHSLSEELREHGPVHPKRALGLFVGALDALSAAHELGIIHKDLKPSNLFLVAPHTPAEELKVVDFGIARFDEEDAGLTGTGQVFGTARYFAPEYISEQLVSPALDVYQMGLILVEILCGLPAVRSNNPLECVMCHGRGQLEIPESLLQGHLGQVIARSLSIKLDVRYADAGAFRDALAEVDARLLRPVDTGEMTLRLNEVSGSMRAISGLNVAVTGQGRIPDSRTKIVAQYSEPESHEVVVDLAAGRDAESAEILLSDTNPEPFTVALPNFEEEPPRSRALPAFMVFSVGLAGLIFAIATGAIIGLIFLDAPAAVETSTAPPSRVLGDDKPAAIAGSGEATPVVTPQVDVGGDKSKAEGLEVDKAPLEVDKPPANAQVPAHEPAQADVTEIELVSNPRGASVYIDGAKVGSTPYKASLTKGDAPKSVLLRRSGYRSERFTLRPGDGPKKSISLRKVARPPSSAPPTIKRPTRIPIAR